MCCTIGEDKAKLTHTSIYVGEAMKDGKYVHVLAYQNMAESASGSKWIPNAMIIPFPTDVPMGPKNVIDTKEYPDFLTDINEATRHRSRSLSADDDSFMFAVAGSSLPPAQVFDVGSYTVILADHVAQVPEALTRVDSNRRPKITTRFLIGYNKMYPNQPVALCCWVGALDKVEPLLWWYEPRNKDTLFIPTMDAHDGNAPDLNALVSTDHIISVGSTITNVGAKVNYKNTAETWHSMLPTHVRSIKTNDVIKNGDMFFATKDLQKLPNKSFIKRASSVNDEPFYSTPTLGWV